MNSTRRRASSNSMLGKRRGVRIVVLVLLALYLFAQPRLNDRFGWNLPGLSDAAGPADGRRGQVDAGTNPQAEERSGGFTPSSDPDLRTRSNGTQGEGPSKGESGVSGGLTGAAVSEKKQPSERPAQRIQVQRPTPREAELPEGRGPPEAEAATEGLRYGLLRSIGGDRFLSPEGLVYARGSAEGHRLEHLRRHTLDQPGRPGKHGVFDGGMEGALQTIDLAYGKAKKRQDTRREDDRDRTIYTVNLKGRVGYVGGRDGKRQGNPDARRVKLVLEGTNVITAYPL